MYTLCSVCFRFCLLDATDLHIKRVDILQPREEDILHTRSGEGITVRVCPEIEERIREDVEKEFTDGVLVI